MSTQVTAAKLLLAAMLAGSMAGCATDGTANDTSTNRSAGQTVDDSALTANVKARLIADPVTKAHQINVDTFQGTVQLSGFVDSSEARSRAAEIARDVNGVKDVRNSLQVRNKDTG